MSNHTSMVSPTTVYLTSAATQLGSDAVSDESKSFGSDGSKSFEDMLTEDYVLPYLAGAATVCCLCLAIVFAVVMWRRRPSHQGNSVDLENGDKDRGDGIYVEIVEAREGNKKTKQKQDVTDNNNGPSSVPHLPHVDTAPDIVTAHDSESIYETLDGRRAAARAKASQGIGVNQTGQRGDHGVQSEVRASVHRLGNKVDLDSTYDHLNGFNRKPATAKRGCSEDDMMRLPEKRLTDPDVSRRQNTVDIKPRNVHSVDETLGGGRSQLERANQDENVGNDYIYSTTQPVKERCHNTCDAETHEDVQNRSVRAIGVGRPSRSIHKESSNNQRIPTSSTVSPKRIRRDSSSGSGGSRVSTASSSLAELARQSSADGKRLVCQLSMVGVTKDGRSVIRQQQSRGNAYFVLEPATDSTCEAACSEKSATAASLAHNATGYPKFRLRTETDEAGKAPRKDYFTLEPLDDEEEVEEELFECTHTLGEMLDSNQNYDSQTETEVDSARKISDSSLNGLGPSRRGRRVRSSLHGQSSVSSFKDLSDVDREFGGTFDSRTQSFRSGRISSCPTPSPPPEQENEGVNCDGSPPLPPRNASYLRSFSSPKRRRADNSPRAERRMDAETLKARIQQEMRALGFLSDLEPGTNEGGSSSHKDTLTETRGGLKYAVDSASSGLRPPRNEYFILEPDPDAGKDDDDDSIVGRRDDPDGRDESVRASEFARLPPLLRQSPAPLPRSLEPARNAVLLFTPRFQLQQTTTGLPPRLPQRNPSSVSVASNKSKRYSHTRSRSETPVLSLGSHSSSDTTDEREAEGGRREVEEAGRSGGIGDDEGPVVISLKKSKSVEPKTTLNSSRDQENDDDFRPRVKSESSILSERKQK